MVLFVFLFRGDVCACHRAEWQTLHVIALHQYSRQRQNNLLMIPSVVAARFLDGFLLVDFFFEALLLAAVVVVRFFFAAWVITAGRGFSSSPSCSL